MDCPVFCFTTCLIHYETGLTNWQAKIQNFIVDIYYLLLKSMGLPFHPIKSIICLHVHDHR